MFVTWIDKTGQWETPTDGVSSLEILCRRSQDRETVTYISSERKSCQSHAKTRYSRYCILDNTVFNGPIGPHILIKPAKRFEQELRTCSLYSFGFSLQSVACKHIGSLFLDGFMFTEDTDSTSHIHSYSTSSFPSYFSWYTHRARLGLVLWWLVFVLVSTFYPRESFSLPSRDMCRKDYTGCHI
jgi:hypothetical protein